MNGYYGAYVYSATITERFGLKKVTILYMVVDKKSFKFYLKKGDEIPLVKYPTYAMKFPCK